MTVPGETEAGSAGKQPCRGIAWRAHRDDEAGARGHNPAPLPNSIRSKDPHALKIPARRAEYSLTENARSPFHAEPEHDDLARALDHVDEGEQKLPIGLTELLDDRGRLLGGARDDLIRFTQGGWLLSDSRFLSTGL
jgi:hypothetical protein